MTVANKIKKIGTYLGYFTVQEYTTNLDNNKPSCTYTALIFTNAEGMKTRDYLAMGDIVYGMYVNDKLTKIGKAGSSFGWYGRIKTYRKNPEKESTNNKIISIMQENYKKGTRIEVYGYTIPRIKTEYFDPITEETILIELPQNDSVETHLTAQAEEEDTDLIFCTQKI